MNIIERGEELEGELVEYRGRTARVISSSSGRLTLEFKGGEFERGITADSVTRKQFDF